MWGIYNKYGKLDKDPESMVFKTRREAVEVLNAYPFGEGYYVSEIIRKKKTDKTNQAGIPTKALKL